MSTHAAAIEAFLNEVTRCFSGTASAPIIMCRVGETKMAYEVKDNSGSIWINDRKDQDTHPDRAGSAKIGGVDYWVNGWLRKTSDGKPYLSLSFKPKQDKAPATNKPLSADLNDEIGF
jgi:hypothetical protein